MEKRIQKLLIANRGEIALRIMRTCRDMGIATVAVFSDADADSPHVAHADEAVRIGPPPAVDSYLSIDRILAAAKRHGVDAVHPGYGFLAESPAFARACTDAGLIFVGPSAEVIGLLGSKRESKRVVAEAGVAVIPGYDGEKQDIDTLTAKAEEIGFPVLIKASAGGGGKGMRVVGRVDEIRPAIESAKREAKSAFGDDTMLIETYIASPRHIEIQILGDSHGELIHLFERECSIQRRHQKIIEETPSPVVDESLRAAMGAAAVTVGKAVGYTNAGTVEFILAPDRRFYFLEVNTRLQVEHPVTECVTGVDLVREQIRVAEGAALSLGDVRMSGAAVECRLYAEDADNNFLPASGRIVDWRLPELAGLRVDAGIRVGQEVSIHYDPMLAKIICHGQDRAEATRKMVYALRNLSVLGVVTNREFLVRTLTHPSYQQGRFDTHFIDTHREELAADSRDGRIPCNAAVAATLAGHEERRKKRAILPHVASGFRNNRNGWQRIEYTVDARPIGVDYFHLGRGCFEMRVEYAGASATRTITLVGYDDREVTFEDEQGSRVRMRVVTGDGRHFVHSHDGEVTLIENPRFPTAAAAVVEGGCVAPMPGKIVALLVSPGQSVRAGETLVILEAMKMEHAVKAPEDGIIAELAVAEGDQVDTDQLLIVVTPAISTGD